MAPGVRAARAAALVVVAVIVLSGCGPAGQRDSAGPSNGASSSEPTAAGSSEAEPVTRYVCTREHASFTIEDILTAPPADAVADAAAAVLRDVTRQGRFPSDGWLRVAEVPTEVVFLAEWPGEEGAFAVVHVVPGGGASALRDGWGADSYGSCTPRPIPPAGAAIAPWSVDADAEPPGPASRSIPALVHEQSCASGMSAEGRILEPSVAYGEGEVTITISVREMPGDCQSNPLTPYVIKLDEPLGDRALLDGGQYPPGDPLEVPGQR